jgi:excisionase family DNA binding protein
MATTAARTTDVGRLWTVDDVSTFLGVPVGTVYQWRHHKTGPPAYKVGRHLRYDPVEVRAWLVAQGDKPCR